MRSEGQYAVRVRVIVAIGLVTALVALSGCATAVKSPPRSVSVQPEAASQATAVASEDETEPPTLTADPHQLDLLDTDLASAIASAKPSMSPDALDACIR